MSARIADFRVEDCQAFALGGCVPSGDGIMFLASAAAAASSQGKSCARPPTSLLAEPPRTLFLKMKYRSVDHGPGISLAAVAIIIVISAVALKYLGS
jgi:hypothetical protein